MTLVDKLDALLLRRGFVVADVRRLMRNQILLAAAASFLACAIAGRGVWGWSFAAGAVIISVNFWWLSKAAQELVRVRHGAVFTLLTLFYGRLVLTAVVVAGLVVWLKASVFGLLAGLSTAVANGIVWGVLQAKHKVPAMGKGKEA